MKRVTRNDVAQAAGVSPSVVSYVLNNSNYVSDKKRQAVLDAVKALDYNPNRFAQGLRTNQSFTIALIGDSLQKELFASLATRLLDAGFYSSLFFSQLNDMFIQRLISGQFDAMFMTSNGFTSQQLNRIVDNGIPMILYKSREYCDLSPKIVSIMPDFYDGVLQVMRHLINKGHRRIAFIPPLRYRTIGLGSDDFRMQAYVQALRESGLPEEPALVCTATENVASIEASVLRMFESPTVPPTAMFVSDDDLAAQLMQYLRTLHISVPDDVAIVGWGDIATACITTPQLTTINSSINEFSIYIADCILQLVDGIRPEDKLFPVQLIVREST